MVFFAGLFDFEDVLGNVVLFRESSVENLTTSIVNGQTTIDASVATSQLLLHSSLPGESYVIEATNVEIIVDCGKISVDVYNACGQHQGRIVHLSDELLQQRSNNGSNFMDCSVMYSEQNLYALSDIAVNDVDVPFETTYLNVEILNENSSDSIFSTSEVASNVEYPSLSECSPIIFQLNTTNQTFFNGENGHYPLCVYFNLTTQTFKSDGCFVHRSNSDIVECLCIHTTFFSASWEEFKPEANDFTTLKDIYADLTIENVFLNYPLGWCVVSIWILFCLILMCIFSARVSIVDTPLIADSDVLYNKADFDKIAQEKDKYRSLKEADLFYNDEIHMSCCKKVCILWKLGIINDHIWFGICCRYALSFVFCLFFVCVCLFLIFVYGYAILPFWRLFLFFFFLVFIAHV